MGWIITFAGNKGGPGKTSELCGLAYAMARRGYQVGVGDMDPQGNATRRLGVDKAALLAAGRPGIGDLLVSHRPPSIFDVAVPCGWDAPGAENISILPSLERESLTERGEESAKPGATGRLRRALDREGWADSKHVVMLDTGPYVNLLLHMAFAASDRVILVTQLGHDSIEGAVYVAAFIDRERDNLDRPDLTVCGVVANGYDKDAARQDKHAEAMPLSFAPWGGESILWRPWVPHRLTLAGSHDDAVPVEAIKHVAVNELRAVYDAHADRLINVMKEGTR